MKPAGNPPAGFLRLEGDAPGHFGDVAPSVRKKQRPAKSLQEGFLSQAFVFWGGWHAMLRQKLAEG